MVLSVVRHLNHAQGKEMLWLSRMRSAVGSIRGEAAASAIRTTRLLCVSLSGNIIIAQRGQKMLNPP